MKPNILNGSFVVFGGGKAPAPFLLSGSALALYRKRLELVEPAKAVAATFGNGYEYALPCVVECMTEIALGYSGPWADELKALCARIATTGTCGLDESGDRPDGGTKAALMPPKPRKPSPSNSIQIGAT